MARLKSLHLLLAFTTLSLPAAYAQSGSVSASTALPATNYTQSTPAPIERATPAPEASQDNQPQPPDQPYGGPHNHMRRVPQPPSIIRSQPAPGVYLSAAADATIQTVSTSKDSTNPDIELRLTHGLANITVHHAAHNAQILVDLPGGQASLLKDGLYTFNAEANRVSVLVGEARAYPNGDNSDHGIRVTEYHQLVFTGSDPHSTDAGPYESRVDLLPSAGGHGEPYHAGYPSAGYDGFYGDPYYGWGYGYPYGYGWGVPVGIGLGFGYYGGWGGGWGFHRGWR